MGWLCPCETELGALPEPSPDPRGAGAGADADAALAGASAVAAPRADSLAVRLGDGDDEDEEDGVGEEGADPLPPRPPRPPRPLPPLPLPLPPAPPATSRAMSRSGDPPPKSASAPRLARALAAAAWARSPAMMLTAYLSPPVFLKNPAAKLYFGVDRRPPCPLPLRENAGECAGSLLRRNDSR